MLDESSIKRQLQRERNFIPPYCPRSSCANHKRDKVRQGFWKQHGTKPLKRFPYCANRFKCKDCGVSFSASIFRLYYRQKVWGHNEEIWKNFQVGVSMRQIGRFIKHDERLVRTRLRNMARWAELMHAKLTEELKIEEPVVYDGLENFSFSQYDPCNINHAVGKESLFIYDFNFSPINRKGRMSERQKTRKKKLEDEHGHYPRDAIRTATRNLVKRLLERSSSELTLYSDCHFQYKRVVEEDLKGEAICHIKVSSKIHRNFKNHLFAVNNIDLQARHNLAAFKRETIAFSKHEIAMQDSFTLYAAFRNYMRPKFWTAHRSDPKCADTSPAMALGLVKKILAFDEFFGERVLPSQVNLSTDAKERYDRKIRTSRRIIAPAPAF